MKRIYFLFCFCFILKFGLAQTVYKQDERIDKLVQTHIQNCEKKETISGYRVQIHFGGEREKAKEIKSKFLQQYPEISAYEIYHQPNFKIRVGDFRTRLEAQKFLKEIHTVFTSSFIVTDEINFPKLD